jgi:hypothetical protein
MIFTALFVSLLIGDVMAAVIQKTSFPIYLTPKPTPRPFIFILPTPAPTPLSVEFFCCCFDDVAPTILIEHISFSHFYLFSVLAIPTCPSTCTSKGTSWSAWSACPTECDAPTGYSERTCNHG